MKKTIKLIYKIFFIGLLLQFVAFNFVSFKLGLESGPISYLRLWKEAIVGLLLLLVLWQMIVEGARKKVLWPTRRGWIQWLLIATIGASLAIDLFIQQHTISEWLVAFKYDFFGFVLFFVGVHSSRTLSTQDQRELVTWYAKVIKRLLLFALIWYAIILIKPGTLKLLGYDNYVFEGTAGMQPPAAYYAQINQGMTRNQFLFERPVSWGFFLTAFWPLFFFAFLYRRPLRTTWAWWAIYALNVFLTFSRAAWGSWLLISLLIACVLLRNNKKKLLLYGLLPVLVAVSALVFLGGKSLLIRGFSDTGHVAMVLQGREMMTERPVRGWGGGSVGPGSHHGGMAFNPENQFLQIRIEFGTGVFLLWTAIYLGLIVQAGRPARDRYLQTGGESAHADKGVHLLFAFAVGLIGLAISGMVLHSFSDRMIVYPYMLLGGIIASYYANEQKALKK